MITLRLDDLGRKEAARAVAQFWAGLTHDDDPAPQNDEIAALPWLSRVGANTIDRTNDHTQGRIDY